MTCDCLNDCGDDHRLKTGEVQPCHRWLERQENDRKIAASLAQITELRKVYGAASLYELIDKMHTRIQAFERLL